MSNNSNSSTLVPIPSAAPVVALMVFGIVGNLIALVLLLCTSKSHKWRPFFRFVCGLAITDGLGTFITTTISLTRYASLSFVTKDFPKHLCNFMGWNIMFNILASGLIVCAMSWDRFTAILFPVYYKNNATRKRTNIVLVLIWFSSALLSSLNIMAQRPNYNFYPGTWCFFNFIKLTDVDRALSIFYFAFGTLMVLITIVMNVLVLVFVCRTCIRKQRLGNKRNIYIIVFLFTVVIVFSTCIIPLLITIFGHIIGEYQDDFTLELTSVRMAIVNSLVDPWLYIMFRRETIDILHQLLVKCNILTPKEDKKPNDIDIPKDKNSESRSTFTSYE